MDTSKLVDKLGVVSDTRIQMEQARIEFELAQAAVKESSSPIAEETISVRDCKRHVCLETAIALRSALEQVTACLPDLEQVKDRLASFDQFVDGTAEPPEVLP